MGMDLYWINRDLNMSKEDKAVVVPVQTVTLEKKKKEKRGAGRPAKIPVLPKDEEVAQLMKDKQKHLEKYDLANQISTDANSLNILDIVMLELAKESASLDFERGEAERLGKDTTNISGKKINTIKSITDTFIRKRELIVNQSFDFKSKSFQKLFEFWWMKIRKSCEKSGMGEEQIQRLFQVAGEEFEDWEEAALKFIKNHS